MLGEYLNSPVTGWGNATPIAQEGLDRNGGYVVRQLHLRPVVKDGATEFIVSPREAAINAWDGEKVVLIVRDPRDVAVSAMHYWGISSIRDTIIKMRDGLWPLQAVGDWVSFIEEWTENPPPHMFGTSYEMLYTDQSKELFKILSFFGLADKYSSKIQDAYDCQRFVTKKTEIADEDSDARPYGKTVQLKNMRKGIVGDWKNYFTEKDLDLAYTAFGGLSYKIGYTYDWDGKALQDAQRNT